MSQRVEKKIVDEVSSERVRVRRRGGVRARVSYNADHIYNDA